MEMCCMFRKRGINRIHPIHHDKSERLSKYTLRFKKKQTEKSFQIAWNKEKKKPAMIMMIVPLIARVLLILFEAHKNPRQKSMETLAWLILILAMGFNYINKGRIVPANVVNHLIYGYGMVMICLASLQSAKDPTSTYGGNVVSAYLDTVELTVLGPMIGGVFLDIIFPAIVFFEIFPVCTIYYTFTVLKRESCDGEIQINGYRGIFTGCLGIFFSYLLLRAGRQSFLRELKLQSQERVRMQEQLKYQSQIVQQKGKYIAQVAHDIGTPLAIFGLAVELLRDLATTSEMKDIIETVQCAIDLMTVTRKEALDHAKHMEGLEMHPDYKEVLIVGILKRCLRLMQGTASKECSDQNEFYVDPDLPKNILSDYDWIWTMLVNLLSNAKKYSNGGKVITTVFDMGEMMRVEVADDGIGVPVDRRNKLFKPFGQLMKCAGGTGLGLHGVFLKASALEGKVGVRENPASTTGSIFWFEIPLVPIREVDDTRKLRPKLGSFLFLGDWSQTLREGCSPYLLNRFSSVEICLTVEEFCKCQELITKRYSVVFWLLNWELQAKPQADLVRTMKEMKSLWAGPCTDGNCPLICISSCDFQCSKIPQPVPLPSPTFAHKKKKQPGFRRNSSVQENSMSMLREDRIILSTNSNSWLSGLGLSQQNTFDSKESRASRNLPSPDSKKHQVHLRKGSWGNDSKSAPRLGESGLIPTHSLLYRKGMSPQSLAEEKSVPRILDTLAESREGKYGTEPPTPNSNDEIMGGRRLLIGAHRAQPKINKRQFIDFVNATDSPRFNTSTSNRMTQSMIGKLNEMVAKKNTVLKKVSKISFSSSRSKSRSKSKSKSQYKSSSRSASAEGSHSVSYSRSHSRSLHSWGEEEKYSLRYTSAPQLYVESPCGTCIKGDTAELLLIKLNKAIRDAHCGLLLQHPISVTDVKSLVLRIPDLRVLELRLPLVAETKSHGRPVDQQYSETSSITITPRANPSSQGISKSVLLVDDDQSILKFTTRMLQKESYNVTTKVNGFEGLNSLKEREYAVAIIDLNMPVMDGLECIRRFREWEKSQLNDRFRSTRQPIIMLSANAHQSHREEAIGIGADRFVAKPIKMVDLLPVMKQIEQKPRRRKNPKNLSPVTPVRKIKTHPEPQAQDLLEQKGLKGHTPFASRGSSRGPGDANPRCMHPISQIPLPADQKTLLLVDDDPIFLKMGKQWLERKGYSVATENDGASALALLTDKAKNHFHVVVMDHQLPGMDGIECIKRFREWEDFYLQSQSKCKTATQMAPKKIFFLSGNDVRNHPDWNSVLRHKIDKVFVKPVSFDEILKAIEA